KDFSLSSLSTKLEISKNMLFIRKVERKVRSWVELVPPLKVMDNQLGEPDTRDHNQSGFFFLNVCRVRFRLSSIRHRSPWSFKPRCLSREAQIDDCC
nr:hypothetical protein [Tanacetum cinerariifolium]